MGNNVATRPIRIELLYYAEFNMIDTYAHIHIHAHIHTCHFFYFLKFRLCESLSKQIPFVIDGVIISE